MVLITGVAAELHCPALYLLEFARRACQRSALSWRKAGHQTIRPGQAARRSDSRAARASTTPPAPARNAPCTHRITFMYKVLSDIVTRLSAKIHQGNMAYKAIKV